jgi:RNA binding exosome subunit
LVVSFLAKQQAKNVGALNMRTEAINHVRHAMHDVILSANIRSETATSLAEAHHLSSLIFSENIRRALDKAHVLAHLLQHIPFDQQTEKNRKDKEQLVEQLKELYGAMVKEGRLPQRRG